MKNFDPMYDYTNDLTDSDIKVEDGREFVFLRGLERLAKERGVKSATCSRLEPIKYVKNNQVYLGGVICTYEYIFEDGRVYQGTADATIINCDGNFKLYLSAMAESRAKARALRTAFGISMCSVEEKSNVNVKDLSDDNDLGPIQDYQIAAIKIVAERNGYSKEDVLTMLEVPRKITTLKELTSSEAKEIINKINKPPRRRKKKAQ